MAYADIEKRRENSRKQARLYYARHREKVLAWQREYQTGPGREKRQAYNTTTRLYRRHGINKVIWDWMFESQNGLCASCGQVSDKKLRIDHDHRCCPGPHSCGRCVRGLVCEPCNVTAGMAGDDPARLQTVATYLARTY